MADPVFLAGQHDAQIKTLSLQLGAVQADVKLILASLSERRGERRVAVWLAGTVGGVCATVLSFTLRKLLHL